MKNRERRAEINNVRRFFGAACVLALLSLAGTAHARDYYCYRHITNNRDVPVTLVLCNTGGGCATYPVAPHTSVSYAIPEDNSHATLTISGDHFRTVSGHQSRSITIFHHKNTGRDWMERLADTEDKCHISRLGAYDTRADIYANAQELGSADFRQALTVNSPADGDIIVNAAAAVPRAPQQVARSGPGNADPAYWAEFDLEQSRVGGIPRGIQRLDPYGFDAVFREGTTAAVNDGRGFVYFFSDGWYSRYQLSIREVSSGFPVRITEQRWPGLLALGPIDAAVNAGNGKIYFFGGGNYLRFDIASHRTDPGYPRPVTEGTWPGLPALGRRIEAATNMGNGKIMFFSGNRMLSFDIAADRADPGYPQMVTDRNFTGAVPPVGFYLSVATTWDSDRLILFYSDY